MDDESAEGVPAREAGPLLEGALLEAMKTGGAAAGCAYGRFLAEAGRSGEAEAVFREVLKGEAGNREALRGLGGLLAGERRFEEAIGVLWEAVGSRADDAAALCALGNVLVSAGKLEEGAAVLRQAVRLQPAEPRLYSNLGMALGNAGRFGEAEGAYFEALERDPLSAAAHNNLAGLYLMTGRHGEAIACAEMALRLSPGYVAATRNRAIGRLALGDFENGWEGYDWRAWGVKQSADPYPVWKGPEGEGGTGESLAGKRILLMGRHGLGDTVQFVRYAPLVKGLGAQVILECPGPLVEVMETVEGVDEVAAMGGALPGADYCVALMDLPRLMKTREGTIPRSAPYLAANLERVAMWRARLGKAEGVRVGIVWQGNPHHEWDRFRSVRLMMFERLVMEGVRLVSLQRGPGREQIGEFLRVTGGRLEAPLEGQEAGGDHVGDVAALMELMEVVVTVDSAPAHLAGGLGRRTWVALSQAADWRWMRAREDTPWYPTMRLFRQGVVGEWEGVFSRMRGALERLVE
jgi:Flp pilus assembly protein TadD